MSASAPIHPLFRRYPLADPVRLSTGPALTPYQIYAGYGVFIGGTAEAGAARALLQPEQLHALTTTAGRALMGIWALDFTEASLGPHHELQFSLLTTRAPAPAAPAHPLAAAYALIARPDMRLLCHGLWNSTEHVVAYNREVLRLNARRCRSRIADDGAALTFEFADAATGRPVLGGQLRAAHQPPLRATFDFARLAGFGRMQKLAAQPWVEMKIVNPVGLLPRNDVALACNRSEVNFVRYFDPRHDQLTLADPVYRALDFQPQFVQHLAGIKFVYLQPQAE